MFRSNVSNVFRYCHRKDALKLICRCVWWIGLLPSEPRKYVFLCWLNEILLSIPPLGWNCFLRSATHISQHFVGYTRFRTATSKQGGGVVNWAVLGERLVLPLLVAVHLGGMHWLLLSVVYLPMVFTRAKSSSLNIWLSCLSWVFICCLFICGFLTMTWCDFSVGNSLALRMWAVAFCVTGFCEGDDLS